MNDTQTTPAPAVGGRQIGQVLAGRYRLAMFKGGDDIADVWHALDDSTEKVVTLEILRDRENAPARQRFLAEAQRMAAIERPSVMRVAAIHNEATETFIVFEHLIPLPVVLTGLTAVAKDARPATRAAEDAAALAAADDAAPAIVDLDPPEPAAARATAPIPHLPGSLQGASRSLTAVRAEVSAARAEVSAVIRTLIPENIDTSVVTSLVARMTPQVDRVRSLVGRLTMLVARVISQARPLAKPAKGDRPRGSAALPTFDLPGMDAIAFAGPLIARIRSNRMVLGAGLLILLGIAFVVSPLDEAIATAIASPSGASRTVAPSSGLERAPFEVPPLGAYGAAFESQGVYPTTTPNGTVEWVVALRNTGSAGWYRGIEGAQAALALPDGTGVAVQSTPYVGPGQVGWFVVHFRARAELGTYTVQLLPRIDGRGPLADLGVFAVVTVTKNP